MGRPPRSRTFFSRPENLQALFLALFLIGMVVLRWNRPGYLIYFWDQTFPLDPARNLRSLLSLWHSEYEFGRPDPTSVALVPYFLLVWGFRLITGSLSVAQTAIHASMLVSGALGAYWLTRELIHRVGIVSRSSVAIQVASLASAMVYTFNPYAIFFQWRIVNSVIFLTGLLPWWLLGLVGYLDRRSTRSLATFGLLSFLMSPGLSNPAFLVVVAFLALAVALSTPKRVSWRLLVPPAVVFLLVSAFWAMPVAAQTEATQTAGTYGGVATALQGNSANLSIGNVVRFIGVSPITETYRGERSYPWAHLYDDSTSNLFTLLPLLPLALVLYQAIAGRAYSDPSVRYLLLAFGGFLFLAKGVHPPGGGVFLWLFSHIPAFRAFRDPFSKFGLGLLVSYTLLVGFATFACLRTVRRRARMMGLAVLLLVTLPTMAFGWPLLTGSVFRERGSVRPSAYVEIPQEYVRVGEILEAENTVDERILSFPQQDTPLMSSLWRSGFVGFDPLRSLTKQPLISTLADDPLTRQYIDAVYESFGGDLEAALRACQRLGIGWLLIRWDNNFAFGGRGGRAALSTLAHRLADSPQIQVEFEGERLSLFRIEGPTAEPSAAIPLVVPSSRDDTQPFLTGVTANLLSGSHVAPLPRFRTDVGDQRLTQHVRPDGAVAISVTAHAQGSVASVGGALPGPLVGVTFSSTSNARVRVAFSKYREEVFLQGGTAALLNPTGLHENQNTSIVPYTLIYDLRTLTFRPNTIHIHVASTSDRSGSAVVSAIHPYDKATINALSLRGRSGVLLSAEGKGEVTYDFYAPWLAHHAQRYLAAEIQTGPDTCFFLGASRKMDGRYLGGRVLVPVYSEETVGCEDGGHSTGSRRTTVYFRIPDGEYNYLHLNMGRGLLGTAKASVDFRNVRLAAFAGGPEDFVELLGAPGSPALLESDAATVGMPLVELNAADGEFISGPIEVDQLTVVSMTERFDDGWVLEARPLVEIGSPVDIRGARHIRVNGLTNGWILDPAWVRTNLPPTHWRASANGETLVSLGARFTPQRYLRLGLAISVATLVGCILFLCCPLSRRRH